MTFLKSNRLDLFHCISTMYMVEKKVDFTNNYLIVIFAPAPSHSLSQCIRIKRENFNYIYIKKTHLLTLKKYIVCIFLRNLCRPFAWALTHLGRDLRMNFLSFLNQNGLLMLKIMIPQSPRSNKTKICYDLQYFH